MGANTRIETSEYPCPCGGGTVSITQWDEERMYGGGIWQTKGVVNCKPCSAKYEGTNGRIEFVLTKKGDTTHPYNRDADVHIYPPRSK